MPAETRVITANVPVQLASRVDQIAERIDRTRSWIVRQAIESWIAEEERRYQLTSDALRDVDEGRTLSHEEVLAHFEERATQRRRVP